MGTQNDNADLTAAGVRSSAEEITEVVELRHKADEAKRPAELPLSEWQLGVENAVNRLTGRIKHTGRNAFSHLRKAWALHGSDDEMSAFRTITAEEEAATALILALQQQRYPGANQLNARNHAHKSAFWPLIATISDFLFTANVAAPKITLSRKGPPRIDIHINLNALAGVDGEAHWVTPDEPLNFGLRSDATGQMVAHRFEEELKALADSRGQGSILKHIENEANQRNLLLYASDGGIPKVTFQDEMLIWRTNRCCVLLMVTIAVLQTTKHQIFAVQCLQSLLIALNKIQGAINDPTVITEVAGRPKITIQRSEDHPTKISLSRSIDCKVIWLVLRNWPSTLTASTVRITYNYPQPEDKSPLPEN